MKSLLLVTILIVSNLTFAGVEGSYRNSGEVSYDCPATLTISRDGSSSLKILGSSGFNEKFNTQDYLDEVVITGINKRTEKVTSKNSSHGQSHEVKRNSIEENNFLSVEIEDKTSFWGVPLSKFKGTLVLRKIGAKLDIEITTSYDEKMSSSKDWSKQEHCTYVTK